MIYTAAVNRALHQKRDNIPHCSTARPGKLRSTPRHSMTTASRLEALHRLLDAGRLFASGGRSFVFMSVSGTDSPGRSRCSCRCLRGHHQTPGGKLARRRVNSARRRVNSARRRVNSAAMFRRDVLRLVTGLLAVALTSVCQRVPAVGHS